MLLLWDGAGQLGADPLNFVTRSTGTLTLSSPADLSVTPARKLTGVQWLIASAHARPLRLLLRLHHLPLLPWSTRRSARRVVRDVTAEVPSSGCSALPDGRSRHLDHRMIKRLGGKRLARLHNSSTSRRGGVLHSTVVKADTRSRSVRTRARRAPRSQAIVSQHEDAAEAGRLRPLTSRGSPPRQRRAAPARHDKGRAADLASAARLWLSCAASPHRPSLSSRSRRAGGEGLRRRVCAACWVADDETR